ncbi:MAG: hypothetical protein RLZZ459_1933 [Cyanobacteriota bacterium]
MRALCPWPAVGAAGLLALLAVAVGAQPLPPPPPPGPTGETAQDCVARFGNRGCAARLYGRLLCQAEAVDYVIPARTLRLQLERDYQQAAIDFTGVTASQIEDLALAQHVPVLCPGATPRIRDLFAPRTPPV